MANILGARGPLTGLGVYLMVFYKSCPKCRGDMDQRQDLYGDFRECLQCGYTEEVGRRPGGMLVEDGSHQTESGTSSGTDVPKAVGL